MDKENVIYMYTHNGVLFSNGEACSYILCRKIDGAGNHPVN
jgi:hypothetical protein